MSTTPPAAVQNEHLRHRFISNGVPLRDHEAIGGRLDTWEGWCSVWVDEADQRMLEAAAAEERRAVLTAAELRLIAALEYHFAKFLFLHDRSAMRSAHQSCLDAYRQAGPHLPWPGTFVTVPHGDQQLAGVLRMPTGPGTAPVPVVIMVPGLDATKEEMHRISEVYLARGMATLAFDGPGQGEAEYDSTLVPDWEHVAASAVRFLRATGGVRDDRIGLVGVSLGGYFAARAAARTSGLTAVTSIGGCSSMGEAWDDLSFLSRQAFRVRSGSTDDDSARERAYDFGLTGLTPEHDVPVLVVHGARDRLFTLEQAERMAACLSPNAQLVVEPEGNHVLHNLGYRVRGEAADWMAERLLDT